GHEAGDRLLQEIGRRLEKIQNQDDTIARLGGDEFALLSADCNSELDLALTIEKIRSAVEMPLSLDGHTVTPGVCIGAAVFPDDGEDAATLAKHADIALTSATADGAAITQVYTQRMNASISRHFWVENNLRRSFGQKQLIPYFQPQLNLENNKPEEAEVLIRWNHPESGLINPGEFIPVAERSGLIGRVTSEVMDASCSLLFQWKKQGLPLSCVAVNVSANLLLDTAFIGSIYRSIEDHGLSPKDILIEITESSAMLYPDQTCATLKEMKDYGFTLAIDDFGTGYSSLAYLHRFAVDQIKIDQSFIKNLAQSQESKSIVKAIIRMCETLGFETLAEGVETKEQAKILQDLGCKKLQGYLIAKPLSASEFEEFISLHGQGFILA
ncbi:MAG: bifunctional diguanylate cyclase/phosphodiesterase, partial [Candidatus Obscuribacterales bacterium]|nr:bifunctional diguanylate cyclase/phosphodiesterase [Candidatus Obscuribacterales bacterium]